MLEHGGAPRGDRELRDLFYFPAVGPYGMISTRTLMRQRVRVMSVGLRPGPRVQSTGSDRSVARPALQLLQRPHAAVATRGPGHACGSLALAPLGSRGQTQTATPPTGGGFTATRFTPACRRQRAQISLEVPFLSSDDLI